MGELEAQFQGEGRALGTKSRERIHDGRFRKGESTAGRPPLLRSRDHAGETPLSEIERDVEGAMGHIRPHPACELASKFRIPCRTFEKGKGKKTDQDSRGKGLARGDMSRGADK